MVWPQVFPSSLSLSHSLSGSLQWHNGFMLSHKIKFYGRVWRNTVRQLKNNKSHFDDSLHLDAGCCHSLSLSLSLSHSPLIHLWPSTVLTYDKSGQQWSATAIWRCDKSVTPAHLAPDACLLSNDGRARKICNFMGSLNLRTRWSSLNGIRCLFN